MRVEDLYDAAQACGLLTQIAAGAAVVWCDFRAPDDGVLGDLALSRDYRITYPASRLRLQPGDAVQVGDATYQVRNVRQVRDGSEVAASLSKVGP